MGAGRGAWDRVADTLGDEEDDDVIYVHTSENKSTKNRRDTVGKGDSKRDTSFGGLHSVGKLLSARLGVYYIDFWRFSHT